MKAQAAQPPHPPPRPQEAYRVEDPFHFERSAQPSGAVVAENSTGLGVQRAGFWIRFVGELIDFLILIIPMIIISLLIPFIGDFLLSLAYYVGFWTVWGATPGKRMLGLQIERPDGSPMGPGRAVARYFASILSFVPLGAGYIMIGLLEDRRGLHDLICDTVVVQREPTLLSEMVNGFWNKAKSTAS